MQAGSGQLFRSQPFSPPPPPCCLRSTFTLTAGDPQYLTPNEIEALAATYQVQRNAGKVRTKSSATPERCASLRCTTSPAQRRKGAPPCDAPQPRGCRLIAALPAPRAQLKPEVKDILHEPLVDRVKPPPLPRDPAPLPLPLAPAPPLA